MGRFVPFEVSNYTLEGIPGKWPNLGCFEPSQHLRWPDPRIPRPRVARSVTPCSRVYNITRSKHLSVQGRRNKVTSRVLRKVEMDMFPYTKRVRFRVLIWVPISGHKHVPQNTPFLGTYLGTKYRYQKRPLFRGQYHWNISTERPQIWCRVLDHLLPKRGSLMGPL